MKNLTSLKTETLQLARLKKLAALCYTKISEVEVSVSKSREPVTPGYQTALSYKKILPGEIWAAHVYDCAWFHVGGVIPASAAGKHVVLHIDIDGEGTVYEGTVPVQMITSRAAFVDNLSAESGKCIVEISDSAAGGENIDLYIDAGFNGIRIMAPFGAGYFRGAWLAAANDGYIDAFYDYFAAAAYASTLEGNEKTEACAVLNRAFSEISSGSPEQGRSTVAALIEGSPADFEFTAIGHSHLDLAWLWPVRETKRKAVRTFTMQLNNLEKHPEYIYGASQPWQFEQLKSSHPELFDRIRSAVAAERLEPQGAMYVEADTNLSGGEALIRQIYYGKTFFNEEFGKDMRICWLPDVFGYNGNLPQILKKSGVPYFFTIKLSWNEHNRFPYRSFVWKGIDGSDVLVHMSPGDDYNQDGSPISVKSSFENYTERDVSREALYVYGIGDGGGGPSRAHIELLKRQKALPKSPKVKFGSAIDFFDRLNLIRDKLPEYSGELYLEKHQGTYTTQGRNKRYNRKTEYALQNIEMLAACATLKGYPYPQQELDAWWKETLLYQFHDIIPGSCVTRVYTESRARYEQMLREIDKKTEDILSFLSGKGDKEIAFNPSPFPQNGVPAWGFAPVSAGDGGTNVLSAGNAQISNGILTAAFGAGGEIVSLRDCAGNEYAAGTLNQFKLYFDRPLFFNAWDIWWKYYEQQPEIITACRTEFSVDGDRAVCTNYYRFGRSSIVQEVSLKAGEDVLRFDTRCSWHNTFKMLRAEFNTASNPDTVTCDIQLGRISRSSRDNTSEEKAQFEICAHKYVDLTDEKSGFSLLNDCKYGHRVKNGVISLNLLRSPIFPDPKADRGDHVFSYAIYPHTGPCDHRTAARAYAINKPLRIFKGAGVPKFRFESSNPEVIIDTVKKAYNSDSIVIRMYENSGCNQTAELKLPFTCTTAVETDLLENNGTPVDITKLVFTPYEIKTIIVRA